MIIFWTRFQKKSCMLTVKPKQEYESFASIKNAGWTSGVESEHNGSGNKTIKKRHELSV